MKNIAVLFFALLFSLSISSRENNHIFRNGWVWDAVDKTVVNKGLNLQWELSDFDWILANRRALPDNMVFCAKCEEGVVLSILELPKADLSVDVWEGADELLKGFVSSISSQSSIFPGINYDDVRSEKCYFLFKKAVKFSVINEIKDDRIDSGSITMIDVLYFFIKDETPIALMLSMPYVYVVEGGEEVINYFFNSFSYINASAEVQY